MESHDIVIIGAGPAGLATVIALRDLGHKDIVVLDRDTQAGGNLTHTNHIGFAPYKNYGLWTGPKLAAHLREKAKGQDVRCNTTVLEFTLRGNLRIHDAQGVREMAAGKIVLATGAREATPASRLIGGRKLQGVMSTGELQRRVFFGAEKPFKRPVIIGTEWISYSCLLTCGHIGAKPVAMIAQESPNNAPRWFSLAAPKVIYGEVVGILGSNKVEALQIRRGDRVQEIACDGVIVSGQLRPESALYAGGYLDCEGSAPKVSDRFKTSRPNTYAVGNVLGQVETAGACMAQGRELAKVLLA